MLKIIYRIVFILFISVFTLSSIVVAEEKVQSEKSDREKKHTTKKTSKKKSKKGKSSKKKGQKALTPQVPEYKGPAAMKELRSWSNPDYTRIAITLDHEARFEYHQLPQDREANRPARLYMDITPAKLSPGVKDIPIADGLLKMARVGQFRADTVRVVLDMESIKDFKVFTFSDPFRILIDVRGDRRVEISAVKEKIEAVPPLTPPPVKEHVIEKRIPEKVAQKATPPVLSSIRRVVVDPGHGGHDPGAIGFRGTKEKDIVLQIGLKLAKKLKEELHLDVVMTRSTDVFLELQERTAIANQVGADLFISVHANAARNRISNGIETYYLSLAKTEKAAQLAAQENGTTLEKVSLLQAVLFDLMANYKINDSAHLAEVIQKELHHKVDPVYQVKSLGVKQGPFYVLVGATMPSILVETAFLSNEKEEQRLKDPDYQELTADGIMEGVRAYIEGVKTDR